MNRNKNAIFCLTVILLVFLGTNIGAYTVSFYVIETGLPEEVSISRYSEDWENALFEVFFDAGHIASNEPILRLAEKPQGDIIQFINLEEAQRGGNDFIIIVQLDLNNVTQTPKEISLFIYRISPFGKIHERKLQPNPSSSSKDEYDNIKSTARGLTSLLGN
jgi:hypothetical protein